MSVKQETVNGVTFEPATLFFELVGVDMEGEPFETESWLHPQPKDYAAAESHARGILDRASLVTCVRILTPISDNFAVRVSTVWR
jgi:propanediol utilization protein